MSADTSRDEATSGTDGVDDDEALTWGTSSDQSYVEGPVAAPRAERGAADDEADELEDEPEALPEGVLSSTMLVVHGIFAAVFLLYTVAWLKSIGSVQPSFVTAIADWMWRLGTWVAVAAPAIWFVGTALLVSTSDSRRRVAWFAVGVLVLIPWPFLIGALA